MYIKPRLTSQQTQNAFYNHSKQIKNYSHDNSDKCFKLGDIKEARIEHSHRRYNKSPRVENVEDKKQLIINKSQGIEKLININRNVRKSFKQSEQKIHSKSNNAAIRIYPLQKKQINKNLEDEKSQRNVQNKLNTENNLIEEGNVEEMFYYQVQFLQKYKKLGKNIQ